MSNIHHVVKGTFHSATKTHISLSHVTHDKPPNSTHEVEGCPVTLNDEDCTLADLKRGDQIVLRGDPVSSVEAKRKP